MPVVIGYDGSPGARHAVEVAAGLFPGRTVLLVHVWPGPDHIHVRTTPVARVHEELVEEARAAARRRAEAVADEGADLARRADLDAKPRTVAGPRVADELIRIVEEQSAAAVVVGRRMDHGIAAEFRDGVLLTLLHRCPVPVVVA